MLAFPQSQSPEGGTLRPDHTGGPTPRLLGRVLKIVLTEPLPGAGAPTDSQSQKKVSGAGSHEGCQPHEARMAVGCGRVGPDPGHRREREAVTEDRSLRDASPGL